MSLKAVELGRATVTGTWLPLISMRHVASGKSRGKSRRLNAFAPHSISRRSARVVSLCLTRLDAARQLLLLLLQQCVEVLDILPTRLATHTIAPTRQPQVLLEELPLSALKRDTHTQERRRVSEGVRQKERETHTEQQQAYYDLLRLTSKLSAQKQQIKSKCARSMPLAVYLCVCV